MLQGTTRCSATAPARQLCCSLYYSCALQHQHRLHSAAAPVRSWFPSSVSHCTARVFDFRRGAPRACAVCAVPRYSLGTRSSASVAGTEQQGPRPDRLTLAQHCLQSIHSPCKLMVPSAAGLGTACCSGMDFGGTGCCRVACLFYLEARRSSRVTPPSTRLLKGPSG